MDWFLYGRDLRHERVKAMTFQSSSRNCNLTSHSIFKQISMQKPNFTVMILHFSLSDGSLTNMISPLLRCYDIFIIETYDEY